jgi:chemotaxis protein MotA
MNITTILFSILGFFMMVTAYLMEGGILSHLLEPTAAMIVFGGTIAAVGLAFPFKDIKRVPGALKVVFTGKEKDLGELIIFFKNLSTKARKNGLLSIESEINGDGIDPFIQKGLQLVVDGVDPQTIQGILELEAESTSERHRKGSGMFEAAGGYSPTMGIIGTVMGLVHVLGNLGEAASLGGKIAPAFIATLYGVGFANIVYLPIGNKLNVLDDYEMAERALIIEAVLLIQTGTNPNTLTEKLKGFLNKKDRLKLEAIDKEAQS